MAHRRPSLVRALQLNTAVMGVEITGGITSNSFSLITDGIHNLSDEVALLLLVLAYSLRTGLSGRLLRYANLLVICAVLIWRVVDRLSQPVEVSGLVSIVAGLIGAIGNWGVARVLREPSQEDVAIRLAYVHNLGDTLVSLIPVAAGILIFTSGSSLFDSFFALLIAAIIVIPHSKPSSARTKNFFGRKTFPAAIRKPNKAFNEDSGRAFRTRSPCQHVISQSSLSCRLFSVPVFSTLFVKHR